MAERHHGPSGPEHHKHQEHAEQLEQPERREHESHKAEKTAEQHEAAPSPENSVEAIKEKIDKEAKSRQETMVEAPQEAEDRSQLLINHDLKRAAFNRNMAHIRRQLSWPSKKFSQLIHNPAVNAASQAGAKTVARPYPLLTAGIITFVGTSVLLYIANHYGFRYKAAILLALMAGGYLVGLVLELIFGLLRRKKTPS